MPLAIALDTRGAEAAGPWIERANAAYPCLIDREHLVARLYGMVNVPTAVWIDETGRIVRGPETAGTSDAWREMDPATYHVPAQARDELRTVRAIYLDALRDWARNGPASVHVRSQREVRDRLPRLTEAAARADACFRLGLVLQQRGRADAAQRWFQEARRLHPDSWSIARQAWDLEEPGKAGGPEFFAAVRALGELTYYSPIDMDGMPR